MRILSAIDSFKGSMTSKQANNVVKEALEPEHQVTTFPIADGGEGTVEAFLDVLPGKLIEEPVTGPTGETERCYYGWFEKEALSIIEVAEAAGITKVDRDKRHPRYTTSYGVGEQIMSALERGMKKCIIGLGGSATVDGGIGLLQALGVRFLNKHQEELPTLPIDLAAVDSVDTTHLDPRLYDVEFIVGSDVENPLLGENGATYVFGPQKGLRDHELICHEKSMQHFAERISKVTRTDYKHTEGSGAAGGIGFCLYAFFNATPKSGFQLLAEKGGLSQLIENADLVITGEGKFDTQSIQGKVPVGISRLAGKLDVPTIVFAAIIDDGLIDLKEESISAVLPIVDAPMSVDEAIKNGPALLRKAVKRSFNLISNDTFSDIP
ncbi:glycerate kinase [Pelagirhabdus alkalitolerans]|uniref:Glycerate kinase n=1 Tax=Pelagirhabdus alkalitolerans TaxID=1612202 RepID=A0A1G6KHD8_9BACI|nr:glycerate kinase [Pelagirhabdus alkalitolerans]SDC29726.1 glycerate kinase [Pelagirhabdus alkalitolerans]